MSIIIRYISTNRMIMEITYVMNFGVVSYMCFYLEHDIVWFNIFFRKIESSALFIHLVNKPPMFQNPNLMDEWLDFVILSILNQFKNTK